MALSRRNNGENQGSEVDSPELDHDDPNSEWHLVVGGGEASIVLPAVVFSCVRLWVQRGASSDGIVALGGAKSLIKELLNGKCVMVKVSIFWDRCTEELTSRTILEGLHLGPLRAALVKYYDHPYGCAGMYLQSNLGGITIFGWTVDRSLINNIFFIELSFFFCLVRLLFSHQDDKFQCAAKTKHQFALRQESCQAYVCNILNWVCVSIPTRQPPSLPAAQLGGLTRFGHAFLEMSLLPREKVVEIKSIIIPEVEVSPEKFCWLGNEDGTFSAASAYDIIRSMRLKEIPSHMDWSWMWRADSPERVSLFLWLAVNNRLMTNAERKRRHFSSDTNCPHCNGVEKTILHCLRDCIMAREVWSLLFPGVEKCSKFWERNAVDWLKASSMGFVGDFQSIDGKNFLATTWILWKSRCNFILQKEFRHPLDITRWARNFVLEFSSSNKNEMDKDIQRTEWIGWTTRSVASFKLNTDGLWERMGEQSLEEF
ncbi:Reverse transcriptase zinc-binding domain [Dillenia turbinata]|uniref:Reverse transcriptase zinc-binding domain n=1 Tax=Dillenia turbinata TaxID=194707 RepID=A0AAN8VJF4_9MAGN